MERLEARIESAQRLGSDDYLVTFLIFMWTPEHDAPREFIYRAKVDIESRNMEPIDELRECFDVYHRLEFSDGLNPRLRRQWETASWVDGIVDILFRSHLLIPWSTEGPSEIR